MTKEEYLLTVLNQSNTYLKGHWVFSVFTVTSPKSITDPYPYQLQVIENKYHFYHPETQQWEKITNSPDASRHPLWLVQQGITINSQSELIQPWLGEFPFRTRVGTLFVNYYCLVSAFDKRIPYQNGSITINQLQDLVAKQLYNHGETDNPNAIYPEEAKKFLTACSSMAGFANIANPSATEYTMQPAPGINEYREQLLKEYEGKLDDVAVVAEIDKKLVAYDKAFQAQDPEKGFYIDEKAFAVSRKKIFVMQGLEQPEMSPDKKTLIKRSLSEGWDIKNLPVMNDSMRDGSYNRGAMTALGGVAVKFIFRVFSMTKIAEQDCGTKIGLPMTITPRMASRYIGNTIITSTGRQVLIKEVSELTPYLNQPVMVRSPGMCKTEGSSFCLTCLGQKLKGSENSLAALASEVGSKMLDIFMAKMHGTALVSVPWRYRELIK